MHSSHPVPVSLASFLLALAACSTTSGSRGGLGSVPRDLVDLYDRARSDGMIELELERDGSIREMEADVPIDALPASLVSAAQERHPGARITGAEREITREGKGWEVKLQDRGRDIELVFDDGGRLIESERAIDRSEAPQAVLQAAERAISGGSFRSVELIEQGDTKLYHVKLDREGASYKVVLTPAGEVTRKVREQRAEIEVPLR